MRIALTMLCLTMSLSSLARAQEITSPQGLIGIGVNFSNLGHDINASYSNLVLLENGSINYSLAVEKHAEAEYDVASLQIAHSTNFKLSNTRTLNFTLPFIYDLHPTADFSHYAIAPRLSLISAFQSGGTLTSFVELSVDRGTIAQQHHSSRRIGASYRFPVKKTIFEVSSSVARLDFKKADDHNTFVASISAYRPIGDNLNLIVSTTFGEDFEKYLRGGEIYRSVTQQEIISISLSRMFSNFELVPYVTVNNLKSEFFERKEITAGFRTNWKF